MPFFYWNNIFFLSKNKSILKKENATYSENKYYKYLPNLYLYLYLIWIVITRLYL